VIPPNRRSTCRAFSTCWRNSSTVLASTVRAMGGRVHPATGRLVVYVSAVPVAGSIRLADPVALTGVRWVPVRDVAGLLPDLYGPVKDFLCNELYSTDLERAMQWQGD